MGNITPYDIARSWPRTLIALGVLAAVIALTLFITGPLASDAARAHRMRTAEGVILGVGERSGLSYSYTINGVEFLGATAELFPTSKSHRAVRWRESAQQAAAWARNNGLTPNQRVVVYFDPRDPGVSALDVSIPPTNKWILMVLPWFVTGSLGGLGAWLLWLRLRVASQRTPQGTPDPGDTITA